VVKREKKKRHKLTSLITICLDQGTDIRCCVQPPQQSQPKLTTVNSFSRYGGRAEECGRDERPGGQEKPMRHGKTEMIVIKKPCNGRKLVKGGEVEKRSVILSPLKLPHGRGVWGQRSP